MNLTTRFDGSLPLSVAQGRHGEVIMTQGNGVRPARWSGVDGDAATDAGIDAPSTPPSITVSPTVQYYIARVDVEKPGACYYSPPVVTLSGDAAAVSAGGRAAKTAAYLSQSGVYEVLVTDGGKCYPEPPSATLSDSHGKDAELVAVLAGPADSPTNSPYTGITQWEVVDQPAGTSPISNCPTGESPRFVATDCKNVDIPIVGDGEFEMQSTYAWIILGGGTIDGSPVEGTEFTRTLRYRVSGCSGGAGAVLRLRWDGAQFVSATVSPTGGSVAYWYGATEIETATAHKYGAGFSHDTAVRVEIDSVVGEASTIVIEGYTAGNSQNTKSPGYAISRIDIKTGEDDEPLDGAGFVVAPAIKITSTSGFGAYATCQVAAGSISSVTLENGGGGYRTPPTVEIMSGGAEVFPVARPHLRGKYQCYYRYVDDTPEDKGGPIPSSLSPVTEVDAGEGAASISWSVGSGSGRASGVELWRTTSNQATMLYRVSSGSSGVTDSLTDEELRDPDREGYAAMPIVLPNGTINANRFTPPPDDKAVVVRFQDRLWYGVDTSGSEPNTVYFSEVDEPESVPDVNQLIVQQNAAQSDSLRALIPFGPTLLLMQSRHAYSLSFSRQPVLDAQVAPIAYRGALNQRCWSIHDGVCYVMDQYGVYSLTAGGDVASLSEPIADLFATRVDFSKRAWPFLIVEPTTSTLRAFVAFKEDDSRVGGARDGYPTRALCYSLVSKTWWVETYPAAIRSATQARLASGEFRCIYSTPLAPSGLNLLDEGAYDIPSGSVVEVRLTNCGSGYRTPPKVSCSGGVGAQLQASIDSTGALTAIWVVNPGFGYTGGNVTISPPDDPSGTQAAAAFVVSSSEATLHPTYRYKSGCLAYPRDTDDPKAGASQSRAISILYRPQPARCDLSLRTYYNNAAFPQPNAAPRSRGVGFDFDPVDNAARLDMSAHLRKYGQDTGVARALLAGRVLDDIASAARHVAVELVGARAGDTPVEFYGLEVGGAGK